MNHKWSQEELAWVRANLHLSKREMAERISEVFGFACKETMVVGVFKNHKIHCGRTGRFQPGQKPFNKGLKCCNGNNTATRYKKGSRPHNWLPVGSERVVLGIVEVKIAEPHQWQSKHSLIWERHHGQTVPPSHVVIFADQDRANFSPENLLLVSRGELAVMNKKRLLTDHAESTKVGHTIARVCMAATRAKKGAKR